MPNKTRHQFETAFGTYIVTDKLGQGGSGIVYAVTDHEGRQLALKMLNPSRVTTEKLKRFRNEIAFCERNTHPNILTILDRGFETRRKSRCRFYVMPLYAATLRSLLNAGIHHDRALALFDQVLNGLQAAHSCGVWHRDLKPENILYDPFQERIVIADFGIAHFHEDLLVTLVHTRLRARLANFRYAAPEQRMPGTAVDHRADIYSLGLILNELYTGKLLQGSGYARIEEVSPKHAFLDELVEQMVQQNADARPDSISRIRDALQARPIEPSAAELRTLSRGQKIAYAATCASRVFGLCATSFPEAEEAIRFAEQPDARRQIDIDVRAYRKRTSEACRAAKKRLSGAVSADADEYIFESRLQSAQEGYASSSASAAAATAACAAAGASVGMRLGRLVAQTMTFSLEAADAAIDLRAQYPRAEGWWDHCEYEHRCAAVPERRKAGYAKVRAAMRKDFYAIRSGADQDDLGPLWPDGTPHGWPSSHSA